MSEYFVLLDNIYDGILSLQERKLKNFRLRIESDFVCENILVLKAVGCYKS